MPFSHHSHSGQFCEHADSTLEQMVESAVDKKMETLVLTEHMPRELDCDLYPEEVGLGHLLLKPVSYHLSGTGWYHT